MYFLKILYQLVFNQKEFTEDYITIDSRSRDVDYWINSLYSINFQSTQGGANLQERFKNIKEISAQSSTIGYNASKEQSEPYLLINIPEIKGSVHSTSSGKDFLGKLYPDYRNLVQGTFNLFTL